MNTKNWLIGAGVSLFTWVFALSQQFAAGYSGFFWLFGGDSDHPAHQGAWLVTLCLMAVAGFCAYQAYKSNKRETKADDDQ